MGQEKKYYVAICNFDDKCKSVSFVKNVKESELARLINESNEYTDKELNWKYNVMQELVDLKQKIAELEKEIKHLKGED